MHSAQPLQAKTKTCQISKPSVFILHLPKYLGSLGNSLVAGRRANSYQIESIAVSGHQDGKGVVMPRIAGQVAKHKYFLPNVKQMKWL
jgi:hypothetical protein